MPELQSCYFCGTADDVTEYAVVPPRFADSDADERTAVLCDQCKEKLMNVVQPLAEKLDAGGAGGAGDTKAGTLESSPAAQPSRPLDDGGITINPEGTASSDGNSDSTLNDGTAGGETDASVNPGSDSEASAGEAATEGAADDGDSPPANYRKAMRLLSNREFPIERYDAEELLGGAYGMEDDEIAAVLDYAVESGRLAEADGTLTRA